MNLVVSGDLDTAFLDAVGKQVRAARIIRLHPRACRFEAVEDRESLHPTIEALCNGARIDHAWVESDARFASFDVLAMDMDSTLITIECIDEIADFIGKKDEVARITEATMRGEIKDFAESLRRRVALLAGADEAVLDSVFTQRLQLTTGARELIQAAKSAELYTLLVSGGFTYFTDRLVQLLGLNAGYANRLEIVNGRLTGNVIEPVFGPLQKADALDRVMATSHSREDRVIVIGDGSNDIPMMRRVRHSVSYHGKPAVVKAATHAVRYGTLATVLDYFA